MNELQTQVNTVEDFNRVNDKIYHDNLVGQLTGWRPLGNQHDYKRLKVLNGYYKIMNFINKRLVNQVTKNK